MDRAFFIDLVENRYFGSVAQRDRAAVLAYFAEDAQIIIRHGDAAERCFHAAPDRQQAPLAAFFDHLWSKFDAAFTEFEHFVDVEAGRCAATFLATLTPHENSPVRDQGAQRPRNCNFFLCRDGLIEKMIIYYAQPGAEPGRATGYPQQASWL